MNKTKNQRPSIKSAKTKKNKNNTPKRILLTLDVLKKIGKTPFKAVLEIEGMSPDTNPITYTLTGALIVKNPIGNNLDKLKTTKIKNWLFSNKTIPIKDKPEELDPFYYLEAHYGPEKKVAELELRIKNGVIMLGLDTIDSKMYMLPSSHTAKS